MSIIGEAALSVFIELLLEKLASSALDYIANYKQVHKQLKDWENILQDIQIVLNDAEQKQIMDEGVKNWLADLQDLAYEVDDILDEFAYEALRLKLQKTQAQASTSMVRKLIPTCCISSFTPTSFKFNHAMISKIEEVTSRLDKLEARRKKLGLSKILSQGNKGMRARQQPGCLLDDVEYVGREDEKREILELLKSANDRKDGVSVITIVGTGGLGKTTLAQLVYNEATIEKFFDYKAWVTISDNFDAFSILKSIMEFITSKPYNIDNLSLLQVQLKEILTGKRFLLVLDDLWNESYDDWTKLRTPFGVGSKIIVTTRLQKVSSNVVTEKAFHLDKLSDGDCLSIFSRHALGASDFEGHLDLKEFGEIIVKRCNGLPLAAKAIGGLLHSIVDPDVWKDICKSEIWDLPEDKCGVIPVLRLSYHHLPPHLKRCFAYCSLLPKDYEFDEEEMILLWRAEGLIKDYGNQCFQELVSRSLFQRSNKNKSRFMMHDLINDLAQSVAREVCFNLEYGDRNRISNRTRHLSYVCNTNDGVKKFGAFDKANSLRTFLPFNLRGHRRIYVTSFVFDQLLPGFKCLRVLTLKGYTISKLPDLFENMKHLRYLDLSSTHINCLPDSICTLHLLEILILKDCPELEELPLELGNLVELKYLDITDSDSIERMPLGIGKLTNLERLSNFILGEGDGHHIGELRNLSNLKGEFCLSGLENIQDARIAKLNDKVGIKSLELQWSEILNNAARKKEVEEQALDFLGPPREKLERLIIKNYGGAKFPIWIADASFKNLLCLELRNCRYCKTIPPIGKLPKLKNLLLSGFHEVDKIGVELFGECQPNAFSSLENLSFWDIPNWKEWDPCEADQHVSKFPSLRELSVSKCPQLSRRLPTNLPSLQKLYIRGCTRLVVSVSSFPSLLELKIDGCEELVDECFVEEGNYLQKVCLKNIPKLSIPIERMASRYANLENFEVGEFEELDSLSQKGFGLVGHRCITIKKCPQLVSLETGAVDEEKLHSFGIQSLIIEDCERLIRLPKVLSALKFLTTMKIKYCPSLVSFAENNLPPTLMKLKIDNCENLRRLLDERENKSISSNTLCLLEDLDIQSCPSLICISSTTTTFSHLKCLAIKSCSNLTSLFVNSKLPPSLKNLQIMACPELECIAQDLHETTGLESIELDSCDKIKSLPRGLDNLTYLQQVQIVSCANFVESGLSHTANLRFLYFDHCQNFGALPKCINNFTSLRELNVWNCAAGISFPEEGFPTNLTSLLIGNAPKIYRSLVEWGLHKLSSLQILYIDGQGCSDVVYFPEKKMMLPPSLIDIRIFHFENLEHIFSNGFPDLIALCILSFHNCPKLISLPEKDMLLSLGYLDVNDCPLLKEELKKGRGKEWSKISHIPLVTIDGEDITL